jgi:dephospho-CoA kinase
MKWIGLTGGIASGKSTVSKMLRELSYDVVDADQIARDVVEQGGAGLRSVVSEFGKDILAPDGSLDRRKMGQKVFGDPVQLQKLEAILHPLVRARLQELKSELIRRQVPVAFYDVPLLYEKNMHSDFNAVVLVYATPEQQMERLRARTSLSETEIRMRIASQIPLANKIKGAHFVIHNDDGPPKLVSEVMKMLDFVQNLKG